MSNGPQLYACACCAPLCWHCRSSRRGGKWRAGRGARGTPAPPPAQAHHPQFRGWVRRRQPSGNELILCWGFPLLSSLRLPLPSGPRSPPKSSPSSPPLPPAGVGAALGRSSSRTPHPLLPILPLRPPAQPTTATLPRHRPGACNRDCRRCTQGPSGSHHGCGPRPRGFREGGGVRGSRVGSARDWPQPVF